MKDKQYNKIINYIDSIENQNEIKPSELSKKINVNKKDIENVFNFLIENKKVIDLTGTEIETTIAKNKKVDYLSLLKISHKPKRDIIKIIGIIFVVLTFALSIIVQWDRICDFFN